MRKSNSSSTSRPKRSLRSVKPVDEQRWEDEGGHPPEAPIDTPKPAFSKDSKFPGIQITRILRELLNRLPNPVNGLGK